MFRPESSQEPNTYLEIFCQDWAQHSKETFIDSGMQMLWMFPCPSVKIYFGKPSLAKYCLANLTNGIIVI